MHCVSFCPGKGEADGKLRTLRKSGSMPGPGWLSPAAAQQATRPSAVPLRPLYVPITASQWNTILLNARGKAIPPFPLFLCNLCCILSSLQAAYKRLGNAA